MTRARYLFLAWTPRPLALRAASSPVFFVLVHGKRHSDFQIRDKTHRPETFVRRRGRWGQTGFRAGTHT